jgi:hypothetical protein
MDRSLSQLIKYIESLDGKTDKAKLQSLVQKQFSLTKDRSVFYTDAFTIRFSLSKTTSFSNTVISLSNLQKYDDFPFVVCLNTPKKNYLYLGNTTFLSKVSHSSQALREDNIRGSIDGSDIVKNFNGITNSPENFDELFAIHSEIGFNGNLARLVEATNNISPSGSKFEISEKSETMILSAPERAKNFVISDEYKILKKSLDETTDRYKIKSDDFEFCTESIQS